MTPTDAANLTYWVLLVLGIAAAFGLLAFLLNKLEDWIQGSLDEQRPHVDDVTERRRVRAEAFAECRRQLDAATGRR